MIGNNYVLWENNDFYIKTPFNPHQPYTEGIHLIISAKKELSHAWENPDITGDAFKLAADVCRIAESLDLAPWFNMQANGNWGLLPGATPFFHIHIYGRNRTASWGKPIHLPEAPKTYRNDPMPEKIRDKLAEALRLQLHV